MAATHSSRHAALEYYRNPVPRDRDEPEVSRTAKDAAAKRTLDDIAALLALADGDIEHCLARVASSDLARLKRIVHNAYGRVAAVGKPIDVSAVSAVQKTPSQQMALAPSPVSVIPLTPKPVVALNPKKWLDFALCARTDINRNTLRLRFALPCADLGLPVGMHIFLKATVNGKPVVRAYTPLGHGPGYVEFIIKVYFANEHPRFPAGGVLTQHMEQMKIGDTLAFKGPLGEFEFDAASPISAGMPSTFRAMGGAPLPFKRLGLIAGGSGITPCLQVANALLASEREVSIHLLYANQSPEDILCEEEIAECSKDERFRIWYTVDRVPEGAEWNYSLGFINEDMLREHMPPAADDTYVFMCGPPPMLKFACRPNLEKLGHPEARVLAF